MHHAGHSRLNVARRHRRLVLAGVLLVFVVGLPAGCSKKPDQTAPEPEKPAPAKESNSNAWIKASPNPVPAGEPNPGKTTVSWDTGNTKGGDVWIHGPKQESHVSGGPRGSKELTFIRKGAKYEVVLYADQEKKVELARCSITHD
jgi:hypothetical protein